MILTVILILISQFRVYELLLLRVASYQGFFFFFCMSYKLFFAYELQVTFIVQVMSFYLHSNYDFLLIAQVMSYFLRTSYELLFIARVTSQVLLASFGNAIVNNQLFFDNAIFEVANTKFYCLHCDIWIKILLTTLNLPLHYNVSAYLQIVIQSFIQ